MHHSQLADLMRPKSLDDIVGQTHLFGERYTFKNQNYNIIINANLTIDCFLVKINL